MVLWVAIGHLPSLGILDPTLLTSLVDHRKQVWLFIVLRRRSHVLLFRHAIFAHQPRLL